MDPFTLATIATVFLTAAATSAGQSVGTRVVDLVFKRFELSGKQQALQPFGQPASAPSEAARAEVQADLTKEIEQDPAFGAQVVEAVNAELQERPELADAITDLVGDWWGLSQAQKRARRGRCPVGGEILIFPTYLNSDGTEIPGAAFNVRSFSGLPPSTIAECRQGHRWPVFAITNR